MTHDVCIVAGAYDPAPERNDQGHDAEHDQQVIPGRNSHPEHEVGRQAHQGKSADNPNAVIAADDAAAMTRSATERSSGPCLRSPIELDT
ncbi:hypothetical protein K0651_03110 [Ornithinimicrobium sp. Arc0846-15]|nr:hypothetical protein [Ornithinimicrobium laminariae]